MEQTPITILQKQIDFYIGFILKLESRQDIDKDAPQAKIDQLILDCKNKIKEFESAITVLSQPSLPKKEPILVESANPRVKQMSKPEPKTAEEVLQDVCERHGVILTSLDLTLEAMQEYANQFK